MAAREGETAVDHDTRTSHDHPRQGNKEEAPPGNQPGGASPRPLDNKPLHIS